LPAGVAVLGPGQHLPERGQLRRRRPHQLQLDPRQKLPGYSQDHIRSGEPGTDDLQNTFAKLFREKMAVFKLKLLIFRQKKGSYGWFSRKTPFFAKQLTRI
jgi:hypothetical protein